MRGFSIFALAAPLVAAIQLTEPTLNSTLVQGETYSVKWTSVDTDPTTFSLFLVDFVNWPPFYTLVASNLQTSAGEVQVHMPCGLHSSWGYQFNAINGTNVYVIYAQTPRFFVQDGACTDPQPGPGPLPDGGEIQTCQPVTVTAAVTSTITVSHSACTASSSDLGTAAAPSTTVAPSSTKSSCRSKSTSSLTPVETSTTSSLTPVETSTTSSLAPVETPVAEEGSDSEGEGDDGTGNGEDEGEETDSASDSDSESESA